MKASMLKRMSAVFGAIALTLWASASHAVPTVLQTNWRPQGSTSGVTSAIAGMQSALTSGSRIVVALTFEISSVSAVAVSDNKNGSYTLDADSGVLAGNSGAGGGRIFLFSVPNTFTGAGSGMTITASWTTGSVVIFSAYEIGGGVIFDHSGTAKTGTTTLPALGFSITPTGATEFVVAAAISNGSAGITVDSGYSFPTSNQTGDTFPEGGNIDFHAHEYIASATGAQNLGFNGTGTGGASMFGAAYKTSGSASSGPSPAAFRIF